MRILIPNLGSTSLKYQVLDMPDERVVSRGKLERVSDYATAIASIQAGGERVDAVALKAVHAGPAYRGTYQVDEDVLLALEQFLPAAPVHNRIYLDAIRAFQKAMPNTPIVAAFETEFHATMPEYAMAYGVPGRWRSDGVQRYGFHGASHEYVSRRVPEMLSVDRESLRLVSCHLGGSSSMCAIAGGRSIDTTMGFSPQSGLENAARHGDLDVFAVLYMMDRQRWSAEQVRSELSTTGGLAGLSGVAGGDVRDIETAEASGSASAGLALAVFAYQVRKTIGAYAAAMGGLDAIAFTGGIGENSARLRAACCEGLEFMGLLLDAARNGRASGEAVISRGDSLVTVVTLPTNEELIVARRAYRVLLEAAD